MTLASFRAVGNTPVVKERLIKVERREEISCFRRSRIRPGILKGPVALSRFKRLIVFSTSTVSQGSRNIELLLREGRKSEKC